MKRMIERYNSWAWETRLLAICGLFALLPVLFSLWPSSSSAPSQPSSLDTHIPRGFVLIPIEVQNYESLDSILGRFGVVDLFPADEKGTNQAPVARNIRLLRAPQNPMRFAVLAPESQSRQILSRSGSYVVVVKRPDERGTEFEKTPAIKAGRKIIYGGD